MPEVSVIIPNYNHGSFLTKRIESILAQTFTDFELVILDDCSTDNSRDVIEKFRNYPQVSRIEYNSKNGGNTFEQWDKGITLCTGKYIWIAESDDWCEPTLLETLVIPMQRDPTIVLAYCQTVFVGLDGNIIWKTYNDFLEEKKTGVEFISERMMGTNGIPNASMAVFRRSSIEKVDHAYLKMNYCGDWLFWTSVCLQGNIFISGKYLNYYRRHNQNVASSAEKEGLDFIEGNRVFQYIMEHVQVRTELIKKAVRLKVDRYFQLESVFKSDGVKRSVVKSLEDMHDSFTAVFRAKRIEKVIRKSLSRVKKPFFSFK